MSELRDVIHYIPKFSPGHWGGAEQIIVRAASELESHGFRSRVWSSITFSEAGADRIDRVDVRRFRSFFLSEAERAAAGLGKAPLSPSLLAHALVERDVDLLHVHTHNRMASALVAVARARRLPVVLSLHSQFVALRPRWRYRFQNEFGFRHASHVTTSNDSIRKELLGLGLDPRRVSVVHTGVDPAVFAQGWSERFRSSLGIGSEPVVLTVGRICAVKNQAVVLDVLPLLRKQLGDVHWVLVGFPSEPDYFETLKRGVIERGLEDAVHVVPGLPPGGMGLVDAYAAADAVVIPSVHEGFPLVLLEAWASGRPLIATRVGGLPEIIHDGRDGLLVAPGDPGALSERILDVLRSPDLAAGLTDGARRNLPEFTWSAIGNRLAGIYRTVLESRT